MYKRKHRRSAAPTHDQGPDKLRTSDDTDFDPSLYIVAYEADIVSGPRAVSAALALECPEALPDGANKTNAGSGLIHLQPQNRTLVFDDDDGSVKARREPILPHLLVDRSDLSTALIFVVRRPTTTRRDSHCARDLPSDAEDTFFFTPDEAEDYRRDKPRKLIDHAREERMRAILARDREREGATEEDSDVWGGSDEEPDETQKELLRRTAVHVVSSPNPAQLEMRILANHGADKRFAFLRGRWSRAWKVSKELARQEQREAQKAEKLSGSSSLQGLIADYGDSEESGDEPSEGEAVEDKAVNVAKPLVRDFDSAGPDEADRQKARRERARDWSARRRAEQLSNEGQG
ncbi:hypothetical protein EDC04DRAFT_2969232 [Pisolithus marmoratus]|nr:hypothetical protein EDC04DRAFT_2969232 [Pisolithus marmoratus]